MTWKIKILAAWERQLDRYENPRIGEPYCSPYTCELCKITKRCIPCPLYLKYSHDFLSLDIFCSGFNSYEKVFKILGNNGILHELTPEIKKAFTARAVFYRKYLPILKSLPAYRFTPSGFRGFPELNRED
jgi:hypothetical protein